MLVVAPRLGTSHFLFMSEFVKALIDRGHEVTFLTIFSLNHLNLKNYTEISINIPIYPDTESKFYFPLKKIIKNLSKQFGFRLGSQSEWLQKLSPYLFIVLHQLNSLSIEVNEKVFENTNFQKFIASTEHTFDVILSEDFFSDAYLMFAHKFQAPVVTVCMFFSLYYYKMIFL